MRVIDDDITPHNSSWSAASTKKLRKEIGRDSVREITHERERQGKKPQPTERETES